ncbi:NACHT domain-containing protein [Actinoplanes sp. NPDC048796]|uniref:NACHT domain-containing protein n=1 Tax=Actinoplanes sp. NPDC048796 TaxID=3155640 RepID=UPI003408D32A
MPALEAATYVLGTAIAKTACGLWAGENKLVNEIGNSAVDRVAAVLTGGRQQRQFARLWEEAAEAVSDRLETWITTEFRAVEPHEREAAVLAVQATFEQAALTEADLFKSDLDAGYLGRYLRSQSPLERAGLSEDGTRLYDLLLRESAAYTIEIARTLPTASVNALTELLARNRQIITDLETVLDRLPRLRIGADFERDYRQLVANLLDRIELFGATVSDSSRAYPLSVAYLSLRASQATGSDRLASVEELVGANDRIFIRGQAGLGKTTLLQWIAVNSARRTFPDHLNSWNTTIPFFVPLRRFATTELPAPGDFVNEVGRHIADEMPPGWVQEQLRSGRGVVLVDGIDELPDDRRPQARRWISELIAAFPRARYVVTSRPGAVPAEWLGGDDFRVVELAPMDRQSVTVFVERWHMAMLEQARTHGQRESIADYQRRLLQAIDRNRHLRQIVAYPLLCALTCALHKDRHGQLPSSRMELYEVALHMLLERRDEEREIKAVNTLGRTQKMLLLQDLAYWLMRNGQSDAAKAEALERIAVKLGRMPRVALDENETYRVLLERSGLIREPTHDRMDFIHRTFQEYLAAKEAVEEGDLGLLVLHADQDQWHETIVMAAGHTKARGSRTLIEGLLGKAAESADTNSRTIMRLLALACLETSAECPEPTQAAVLELTRKLLPPENSVYADMLARAGSLSLDLLMNSSPQTEEEISLTIRAIGKIGDPAAIGFLAQYSGSTSQLVRNALVEAWVFFEPEVYAIRVLGDVSFGTSEKVNITDQKLLQFLPLVKNARSIRVHETTDSQPVDLSFARRNPEIREIQVESCYDLSPLTNSNLHALSIWHQGDLELDLQPLATVSNLTSLLLEGNNLRNIEALRGLHHLHFIGGSAALLAKAAQMPSLRTITRIMVSKITHRDSIKFLEEWSDSAISVMLSGECPTDLTPLTALTRLSKFILHSRTMVDPTPIGRLNALNEFQIMGDPQTINAVLPHVVGHEFLNTIRILSYDEGTIDMSLLAGTKASTITLNLGGRIDLEGADKVPGLLVVGGRRQP